MLENISELQGKLESQYQTTVHDIKSVTKAIEGDVLEWSQTDGSRTGQTTLGSRMSKFEKLFRKEKDILLQKVKELSEVNEEINDLIREILTADVDPPSGQVVAADLSVWREHDREQLICNIDVLKQKNTKLVEEANAKYLKALQESEKVSEAYLSQEAISATGCLTYVIQGTQYQTS